MPARAGASLRLQVPPDAQCGRSVRESVVEFTSAHAVSAIDTDEFVTAVSEALANAIEHSGSDNIEITCWIGAGDQLLATVVDHGIGFAADEAMGRPPALDLLAERGRGLPIMRRFTDLCSIRSAPGKGTTVTLGRHVRYGRANGDRSALVS